MMNRQIDLAALARVASNGNPLDTVVVSRRWLAQVAREMQAQRQRSPQLDFSPTPEPKPDVSIHFPGNLYAGRIDSVSAVVGAPTA